MVVTGVNIRGDDAPHARHRAKLHIELELTATAAGSYEPRVAILIMDKEVDLARLFSPPLKASLKEGDTITANVVVEDLTLAPGEYEFSVGLYRHYDPNDSNTAKRFDLLGRSFGLKVIGEPQPGYLTPPGVWSQLRT